MAFPTTPVIDTFNRADGPLGANWSVPIGTGGVTSNQAGPSGGSDLLIRWTAYDVGPNAEVFFDVANAGAGLAMSITDDAAGNYYGFNYDVGGTASEIVVAVSSVETRLGATFALTIANGEAMGMARRGDAVEVWHKASGVWSLVASRTDTTYTVAGKVAMYFYGGGSGLIDNFGAGTITEQPLAKRYGGVPFMRRGGTTFGQGWN